MIHECGRSMSAISNCRNLGPLFLLIIFLLQIDYADLRFRFKRSIQLGNDNGKSNLRYGSSVAISAEYIAIGVPFNDEMAGSVEMYAKDGGSWRKDGTLVAPGDSVEGTFGMTVALNNNVLIVGRPEYDSSNGEVLSFVNNGTDWIYKATFDPYPVFDLEKGSKVGMAIDVSKEWVVFGADKNAFVYRIDKGEITGNPQQLTRGDVEAGDFFGRSIAVSDTDIVVGALRNKCGRGLAHCGAVYVYQYNGSTWNEVQKLLGSIERDSFGMALDIDENRIVVGSASTQGKGQVRTFIKDDYNTWVNETTVYDSDGEAGDIFGQSVAISGDKLVIGAPTINKMYVFQFVDNKWDEIEIFNYPFSEFGTSVAIDNRFVVGGAPSFNDTFGASFLFEFTTSIEITLKNEWPLDIPNTNGTGMVVAISEEYIAIGSQKSDQMIGSVILFSKDEGLWREYMTLQPPAAYREPEHQFGSSVALDGNNLIVAQVFANSYKGAAHLFRNNGSSWVLSATFNESCTERFGLAVAISETWAIVGCSDVAAHIFKRLDAASTWQYHQNITGGEERDRFGSPVVIHGADIAVGATGAAANIGEVYIFKYESQWKEVQKLKGDSEAELFGHAIAMDENRLIIGSPRYHERTGRVQIFVKDVTDTWIKEQILTGNKTLSEFGQSVAISGDILVVGTLGSDKVHVFQLMDDYWSEVKQFGGQDRFGVSVAIVDRVVVVGDSTMGSPGFVSVYDFSPIYIPPVTVECHESYMKALYYKASFPAEEYSLLLSDHTCNASESNSTYIWISTAFEKCGTIITETENRILFENSVNVKHITSRTSATIIEATHLYNLKCEYPRSVYVSLSDGYDVQAGITRRVNTSSVVGTFSFKFDIYDSIEYAKKTDSPITVASGEPIYVGISVADNTSTIKFAVEQCFATPSTSINDVSDIFFHQKCKIDLSFEQILSSPSHFRFSINAFRFIEVSGAVYLHCRINVCTGSSNSPLCHQACLSDNRRKRRALTPDDTDDTGSAGEVLVTSKRILHKQKQSCQYLTCPSNAKCAEIFPAQCRCNPGFVFAPKDNTCSSDLKVDINEGLRLDLEWHEKYLDPESIEYLTLAINIEQALYTFFTQKKKMQHIEGVRVNNLKKGSVIVDYSLRHSTTSNPKIVIESLINIVKVQNETIIPDTVSMLEIKIESIADVGSSGSMKINACSITVVLVFALVSSQLTNWLS